MNVNMLGGAHLLRYLGLDAGRFLSQLEGFHSQQLDMLQHMRDGFHFAAGFTAANQLASMLQSGMIPGAGMMMAPNMALCPCSGMYAQPRMMDFGASPGEFPFSRSARMARREGAQFERLMRKNPFLRNQVEMMMGGRIIPTGMADGRMMVMPFPPGMMTPGGSPNPANMAAMEFLNQITQAAAMMGPLSPFGMFQQMMMGALANVLGGAEGVGGADRKSGGGSPYVDWADGAHKKGENHPAQGAFGMGDGGDVSAVLNDSSLTVEDKVTLMLMLIMKKMDKDIEKQAEYVNKLQQQQNKKGGKGGGKGKGGGGGSSPSIDVETMKLKRMIDKRSQMFDMLRQIIDKYNETAKNIIQSMGR